MRGHIPVSAASLSAILSSSCYECWGLRQTVSRVEFRGQNVARDVGSKSWQNNYLFRAYSHLHQLHRCTDRNELP